MSNVQIAAAPVITIDGPTSSGKGTIGRLLAEKLGWHYLDSGVLYRVVALAALEKNISSDDHAALQNVARNLPVEFINERGKSQKIFYQGRDVTHGVRQENCGIYASKIAVLPEVREAVSARCRDFRVGACGLIADGRDMGTVVFKDAVLKIFLTASEEERAARRWRELQARGMNVSLEEVAVDLRKRDKRDAERVFAPLKPAADALVVDTTDMSIDEVLQFLSARCSTI